MGNEYIWYIHTIGYHADIKRKRHSWALVVYAYNTSFLGSRDQEHWGSRPTLSPKIIKAKRVGGVVQSV
jgi:hypothetical protein